jgi:Flp pilus assembly pilin Flp
MFRYIGKDEAGVSAPEYAVLLLLLVAGIVVAVGALNAATSDVFNNAANGMSDAAATSGAGTASDAGPSSSPTNSPPSSNGGGHGNSDNAPGHTKSACSTSAAKCMAPGHNK